MSIRPVINCEQKITRNNNQLESSFQLIQSNSPNNDESVINTNDNSSTTPQTSSSKSQHQQTSSNKRLHLPPSNPVMMNPNLTENPTSIISKAPSLSNMTSFSNSSNSISSSSNNSTKITTQMKVSGPRIELNRIDSRNFAFDGNRAQL